MIWNPCKALIRIGVKHICYLLSEYKSPLSPYGTPGLLLESIQLKGRKFIIPKGMLREHSHMTSDVFGSFLTYLHTRIRYHQMWLDLPKYLQLYLTSDFEILPLFYIMDLVLLFMYHIVASTNTSRLVTCLG